MNYYLIKKTDSLCSWKPINLTKGFSFSNKMVITLYNQEMINYILNKKLNKSLRKLISLFLEIESSEDEDSSTKFQDLIPKVETLRKILIEQYALYLSEYEIETYLTKYDKFLEKIDNKLNQKRKV